MLWTVYTLLGSALVAALSWPLWFSGQQYFDHCWRLATRAYDGQGAWGDEARVYAWLLSSVALSVTTMTVISS